MKILCTICARSNSKGLKNKNFLKIRGKSLIEYTIEQAINSKIFKDIVVSVNKKNIFISKKNRKKVYFIKRPETLARQNSNKIDAIRHAYEETKEIKQNEYDIICDLDVSSPLRNIKDIKNSVNKFKRDKANILFTVSVSKKNPYFNVVEKNKKKILLVKKGKNIHNRQKAPITYDMNASIYIWKKNYLSKSNNLFGNKTSIFIMPPERSIDIDSKFDFELVKYLFKKNK